GVGREPLLGELEGDPGAGGVLEEGVDDGLTAQDRHFLDRPFRDLLEGFGGVEDAEDLLPRELFEPEQILAEVGGVLRRHPLAPWTRVTASSPSRSGTITSIRALSSTVYRLPTMSA